MGFWDKLWGREETQTKGAEFSAEIVRMVQTGGWPWSSYGQMYRKQPAVRTVVDFLARNVAQLNLKVYERLDNTDRIELADHPLAALLRNPNPASTRYRHLFDTVADLAIYDRAYWRKFRVGSRIAVVRLAPARMQRDTDANTGLAVYRYLRDGGEPVTMRRQDLVIFRGYSPDGDDDGVSPLETLRRVLAEEHAAQENRENYWRNAARQSGWIERPIDAPDWSDPARERFRADVESTMSGGANSGRIGILEEGMRWNPAAFSPRDSEYIEGRRLAYEEVARAYGVPPTLIGTTGETKANVESFHRQMYQDVLGPWLRMLQDEIELQLLVDFDSDARMYVEFNLHEKLKGSFEEQGRTLVTAVGVPYMTPNEARARLNLPRIEDASFDMPVQPLNVLYGGQPAVTVPTEDPGTAALPPPRVKAAPSAAVRRRQQAAKRYEDFFRSFFERQEKAVRSGKAHFDEERWNKELSADLYALGIAVTRKNGRLAARQIDGVYNEEQTLEFLAAGARSTAENVNAHTREALTQAEIDEVFEKAKTFRAGVLGLSQATTLINFSRTEAAKHTSARGKRVTKTWVVTNPKSRHPEMNGETVGAFQAFSNGAEWPGDPVLSADQAAGCQCYVQLGGE